MLKIHPMLLYSPFLKRYEKKDYTCTEYGNYDPVIGEAHTKDRGNGNLPTGTPHKEISFKVVIDLGIKPCTNQHSKNTAPKGIGATFTDSPNSCAWAVTQQSKPNAKYKSPNDIGNQVGRFNGELQYPHILEKVYTHHPYCHGREHELYHGEVLQP